MENPHLREILLNENTDLRGLAAIMEEEYEHIFNDALDECKLSVIHERAIEYN
jgi:hypothetical protein